jgi:PHD/YefM family antitoxin component YafN of YafNO toxin-antitoxin module
MKLPVTITKKNKKTYTIEFDADRWERIAAALDLFSDEFLEDIEAAEKDLKEGRIREIKSFRDLDD